jgi:predicted Zn-dependent protease
MEFPSRLAAITAVAFFIGGLASGPAGAVGSPDPANPDSATTTTTTAPTKPDASTTTTATPSDEKKNEAKPGEKKPEETKARDDAWQSFVEGYHRAYALIQKGEYEAGIKVLRSLHHDTNPDVANYLGYSNRKLGRYDDARYWYEAALKADPRHTRTWQYYGLWHLEQGNRLKAEENLEKIRLICGGTACDDYQSLKHAIDVNQASY